MPHFFRWSAILALVGLPACGAPPDIEELAASLEAVIEREIEHKAIPALSIALVDDQEIVWARGFGFEDPEARVSASPETVYRVGSVSKLFTDIAVMQLVERGSIDLDRDVTEYLPELVLDNPFDKAVTIRQLMAHRAGLIREPPVGNYFDPTEPSLAATIESLNGQKLVYEPTTRVKYSNAGVAIVGYVLERVTGMPFTEFVRSEVIDAFAMTHSDFEPSARVRGSMAKGEMWTYDGRRFEAPTFQLGMAPAGSLYSTVLDLGRFMSALFRGGGGVLGTETLESMYAPQFRDIDESASYGLGFRIAELAELDGRRRLGHGGAIYGFSTQLFFLPDEKLGVVAVASKDFTNVVVGRIADYALRGMLAVKNGAALPKLETTEPLSTRLAREITEAYDVAARGNRLFVERGARRVELRARGAELVVDSPLAFGDVVSASDFEPLRATPPPESPERFRGLIGEYGWDHNILYIFERDGKLEALIEWFESYPLEEIAEDRFAFPDYGLYHGEELVFERDGAGQAQSVVAASVRFERRELGAVDGETFRIEPLESTENLRVAALAASPPAEEGQFREPELIEPIALDATIHLDIRYASTNNFMGAVFYDEPRAFLQRPAAEALVRAHQSLREKGYGILIHDAYRPWYVTKMFYDATPEEQKIFVADPQSGSRHNRGAAADITLYDMNTGEVLPFVSGYDEFSPRAFPDYPGGTSRQRWLRNLLRREMETQGFDVYEFEWWHFDHRDWQEYPILNQTFDALGTNPKSDQH